MNIGIYGHMDKRPFVYTILKLLQATGDVALISNNRHYRRLLEGRDYQGHFANIMVSVTDATPDEVFEELGQAPSDFDHIIYDIDDSVPSDMDVLIYLKGYPLDEEDKDFLEVLGDHVVFNVLDYDNKSSKTAYNIKLSLPIWKSVEMVEAYRILEPIKSNSLSNAVAKLLSPYLHMNEKAALKLLARRWDVL